MKIKFRNNDLEKLADWIWDEKYPLWIAKKYRFILAALEEYTTIREILQHPWRNAEWKKWNREDQIWIRINKQWRLLLKFENEDTVIVSVIRELSKHYE